MNAGLLDPTPGISRAIAEAESASKGIFLYSCQIFTHFSTQMRFHMSGFQFLYSIQNQYREPFIKNVRDYQGCHV